jgi:hypothetical protein
MLTAASIGYNKFVSERYAPKQIEITRPVDDILNEKELTVLQTGHKLITDIRAKIYEMEVMGLVRTQDQVTITEIALSRAAAYLYKQAYGDNEEEIIEFNNWHLLPFKMSYYAIIIAQRRMGKSVAAEMAVAAMLLACPNIKIIALAKSSQSAEGDSGFLGGVRDILLHLFKIKLKISNPGEIKYMHSEVDYRVMFAYVASVDGLRGAGCDFLVADECSFYDKLVWIRTIFPVTSPDHVGMLGLSTLATKEDEFVSRLIASGRIPSITFSLVCPACRLAGETEVCKHRYASRPRWFGTMKTELIKSFMEDDPEDFAREIIGANPLKDEDNVLCFKPENVMESLSGKRMPCSENPDVFVCIDPAGGSNPERGFLSNYAVIACILPAHIIYAGAFNANLGGVYIDENIISVIDMIKQRFPDSKIIVGIEASQGIEHARIQECLRKEFTSGLTFVAHFTYKAGLKMDPKNKDTMVQLTRDAFKKKLIKISEAYLGEEKWIGLLQTELLRFKRVLIPAKKNDKAHTFYYSGKGSGGKKTDDLAICLMWCIFVMNEYIISSN